MSLPIKYELLAEDGRLLGEMASATFGMEPLRREADEQMFLFDVGVFIVERLVPSCAGHAAPFKFEDVGEIRNSGGSVSLEEFASCVQLYAEEAARHNATSAIENAHKISNELATESLKRSGTVWGQAPKPPLALILQRYARSTAPTKMNALP